MRLKTIFSASLAVAVLAAWTGESSRAQAQSAPASQQASSSQASVSASPMQTTDVQALLYKIYAANFRVGDLTGSLTIDQWKLSDQDRASLRQKADSLRDSATKLEKVRADFYNHPTDTTLAQSTAESLHALPTQIEDFATTLDGTPGASFVKDYQQAAGDLRDLDRQLEPYIAYLQAKSPTQSQAALATPQALAASPPGQQPGAQNAAEAQKAPTPVEAPKAPAPTQPVKNQIPNEAGQAQAAVQPSPPPAPAQPTAAPAQPETPPPSSTEAGAHPAVTPAAMPPADAQAILYKIYAANFRVGDLTASLGIGQWKLPDQDRAALAQKAETLRAAVATVEKARNDFYNHPEDSGLAGAATSAIQWLLPKIDDFAAALANTPGASNAKDYQQAAADLRTLNQKLEPYAAYLEAKNQPPPAPGGVTVETEVIKPSAAQPPITVAAPEKSPLNNEQLKTLLYQAYVPAFRLKDMLSQEHPDTWKIPAAERTLYNDSAQALEKRLADLASWRDQLEAHPESLDAAFQTYAALGKISEPAGIVGHIVSQYGDPKDGSEYAEKARQVAEFRDQIEPYVGYLLRRHDEAIGTVERNFVRCETELTSVMRPTTVAAEPMKNVLPVFKGRGRSVTRGSASHKAASHPTKSAKPASSKTPSGSSPGQ
jgi:hypothetical protein